MDGPPSERAFSRTRQSCAGVRTRPPGLLSWLLSAAYGEQKTAPDGRRFEPARVVPGAGFEPAVHGFTDLLGPPSAPVSAGSRSKCEPDRRLIQASGGGARRVAVSVAVRLSPGIRRKAPITAQSRALCGRHRDDYAARRAPPSVLVRGSCQRCCQASNSVHECRILRPTDRAKPPYMQWN